MAATNAVAAAVPAPLTTAVAAAPVAVAAPAPAVASTAGAVATSAASASAAYESSPVLVTFGQLKAFLKDQFDDFEKRSNEQLSRHETDMKNLINNAGCGARCC